MFIKKRKRGTDTADVPVTITSVEFRNFKAFQHYSVKLQHMNIMVGPNNSGKSTIIGAFRALAAGLRRARARSPEYVEGPNGLTHGYYISSDLLPISIENVHTDYSDTDTNVTFRLSNDNRLRLFFPSDGGCVLIPEYDGKGIYTPSAFRNAYPITIGLTPVLGPIEHDEVILNEETVRRDLVTHRASRQFRNFWYYNPEGFDEFSALVSKTWPGMEIRAPKREDPASAKLSMFCLEKRISRELYWAGFGFQIWCQLLTHISRAGKDAILVIDEPEIYLHPDVQRQLLGILREAGPDILLATHSTEIMSEADPSEILLIDKRKRAAERLRDIEEVQAALDLIGSIQNITLTQLARNQRVLFVEGLDDFRILRRFATKMGLTELSTAVELTPVESGGFSSWERIRGLSWGLEKTLRNALHIGAIFDRDYWSDEELAKIVSELNEHLEFAHIHSRKEIENYLLVPDVLERAFKKGLAERARRSVDELIQEESIAQILDRITTPLKNVIQAQYISKRSKYFKHSDIDPATLTSDTIERFERKWCDLNTRMEIVPGKQVLRTLREELQSKYGVNLTDYRIIEEFKVADIPTDLHELLQRLEQYRKGEQVAP